jgi:hypothetical protein
MNLNFFFTSLTVVIATMSTAMSAPPTAQQAYIKASNTGLSDLFGQSVAASGATMVIGAPQEDSDTIGINGDQTNTGAARSGAAYVFVRDGTNWVQQAYLKASNTGADDRFGYAVAISGNTIVVGALYEDSNALGVNGDESNNSIMDFGAAYVFVRTGTNWAQQAYLKPSKLFNYNGSTHFGGSVAVSGDVIVIGAPGADAASGAAFIFARNGTTWTPQQYILHPGSPLYGEFGLTVSASGETVAVAGNNNNPYAYVFVRSGTNWIRQGTLNTFKGNSSVSVSGNTLAVGNVRSNSARIYIHNGTNWEEQAELEPSNAGGNFGSAVSVSGDLVLVGAPAESSSATGVNSDQSNTLASASGAAYVFIRTGTNWAQQAYLKASNTGSGDHFGTSVAASGDTAVIGAESEDSNAIGVNGDQHNENAAASGAAYVFAGAAAGPALSIAEDGGGGYFIRFNALADFSYQLERAPSVTGPWTSNASFSAISTGPVEFQDANAPAGPAFYRVAQR